MRRSLLAVVLVFVVLVPASLASASHKGGSDNGDPPEQSSAGEDNGNAFGRGRTGSVTENNDSDGIPDVVADDGDNRHPSGRDRSVEPGRSGEAGGSLSDPDDDGRGPDRSNGGPDKPGGSGGVDQADQDWNNGCGNDDDFEDDNEGLCLGQRKAVEDTPVATLGLFVGAVSEAPDDAAPTLFVGLPVDEGSAAAAPNDSSPDGSTPAARAPAAMSAPAAPAQAPTGSTPAVESEVAAASSPARSVVSSGGPVATGRGSLGLLPFTGISILLLVAAGLTLTETGRRMVAASRRRLRALAHLDGPVTIERPKAA